MADILVLALFGLTRLHGLGGIAALENLHPRFFISADDEASLLVEAQRLAIELIDILRLCLTVGSVAVEPIHAPMRLKVGLLQDAPDAGATYGVQPMLRERGDQVGAPGVIGRKFTVSFNRFIISRLQNTCGGTETSSTHLKIELNYRLEISH